MTGLAGGFAASNLPADTYYLCLNSVKANQLASCDWTGIGETGPTSVTLTADQNLNNLKLILRTGSLVVLVVKDPMSSVSKSFLGVGVVYGSGGYYGLPFR